MSFLSKKDSFKFLSAFLATVLLITFIPFNAVKVSAVEGDGPYEIYVIDKMTNKPIKGAEVVLDSDDNNYGYHNDFRDNGKKTTDSTGTVVYNLENYFENRGWRNIRFKLTVKVPGTGYENHEEYIWPNGGKNNQWQDDHTVELTPSDFVESDYLEKKIDCINIPYDSNLHYAHEFLDIKDNNAEIRYKNDIEPSFTDIRGYDVECYIKSKGYYNYDEDTEEFYAPIPVKIVAGVRKDFAFVIDEPSDVLVPSDFLFSNPAISNLEPKPVKYASSDPNIASVDEDNGNVDFKKAGTVTVTATMPASEHYAERKIEYTITGKYKMSAIFTKSTISSKFGEEIPGNKLKVTGKPDDPAKYTVAYELEGENADEIASINSTTGIVTAKKPGIVIVKATVSAKDYFDTEACYVLEINQGIRTLNDYSLSSLEYDQSYPIFGEKYDSFDFEYEFITGDDCIEVDKKTGEIKVIKADRAFEIRISVPETEYYEAFDGKILGKTKQTTQSVDFSNPDGYAFVTNANNLPYELYLNGEPHYGTFSVTWDGKGTTDNVIAGITLDKTVTGSEYLKVTFNPNEAEKAQGPLNIYATFDGDDNYEAKTIQTMITLEKSKTEVTITANDQTYTYNGKIQGPGDAAFEDPNDINRMVKVEGLSEGDKLECIQVDGQSDTADSKTYSAVLVPNAAVIKRDGKDVTNQYDIRYVNGSIIIEPAKVTLTSESGEKEYDGTPLTDSTVTVTGDGFAKGEGATYNVTGSQTKVGGEDGNNTFTYTLNEGTKASNYDIRTVCGTLTVKANATEIKITSADGEQDYSGSEFHKAEYVVKYGDKTVDASADGTFTLPTGDKLTVTDTSKVKEVSDTADGNNEFTYVLENSDQYSSVSVVFGKLTVKKAGAPVLTDANKPKANDLTENGSDQALITVPETVPEGYTVEYSTDGQNWSTDIPTGKDSGEYSVQVRYVGDDNHESFDGEAVTVKIKAVYTLIWLDAEGNELDKKTYVEGEDVPSTDKKPTKAEDADNTYTFDKWDEGTVDGKTTTYRPTFTATKKENPATGDGDAIFIWLAFTAVSGAVLAIAYRKKRTAVR